MTAGGNPEKAASQLSDPDCVIAVALCVATVSQNAPHIDQALAPDGDGLHVQVLDLPLTAVTES